MIRFACPRCGTQLSAPPECAGRGTYCRSCKNPVIVPAPVAVAVPVLKPPPAPSPAGNAPAEQAGRPRAPGQAQAGEGAATKGFVRLLCYTAIAGAALIVLVLVLNIADHTPYNPLNNARCPHCGKRCQIDGMDDMLRSHREAKVHQCDWCGRKYSYEAYRQTFREK